MDTDVISIEASKADMKLLQTFKDEGYNSGVGPGVYDIHSPRVPSQEELKEKVKTMLEILDPSLFFVNPDCGLKTRGW